MFESGRLREATRGQLMFDQAFGAPMVALAEQGPATRWLLPLRCAGRFVLLACLVGLSALAHASPPDPLWLPGIYDGADDDNVVALLTDTPVAGDSSPLAGRPTRQRLEFLSVRCASARADRSLLGSHPRSPPLA